MTTKISYEAKINSKSLLDFYGEENEERENSIKEGIP